MGRCPVLKNAKKTTKIFWGLTVFGVICFCALSFLKESTTKITIRNDSNEEIENLIIASNVGRDYTIPRIEPYEIVEFQYNMGNFNENALNMRHVVNENRSETYNLLGYIDRYYENIFVYIESVDEDCNLNISVKTP